MGFELNIASKHDPLTGCRIKDAPSSPKASFSEVTLNGTFDDSSSEAVLRVVNDLFDKGGASIIVIMDDVRTGDAVCFQRFAAGLMLLRDAGAHVQVYVREAALHAKLSRIGTSRDWLLTFTERDVHGARRALHFNRRNDTV